MAGKPRHGMYGTPTYNSWARMMDRCRNPKNIGWHLYGGRGIGVCKRWYAFENFLSDMGVRPDGRTLDRVDNTAGYSRENCRWASRKEQAVNRRTTTLIEFRGKKMSLKDWSKELGIKRATLWARLRLGSWDLERAFTEMPNG